MSFAGRADLLDMVDQLVAADGGLLVDGDTARPVLIVEGCAGSGRSQLLCEIAGRWGRRAMTAEVDPRALAGADAGSPRPLLAAVLLGFWRSTLVPGFEKVSFERVILAHIAMAAPIQSPDPKLAIDEMSRRLNTYRNRGAVIELVGGLVSAGIQAISRPAGAETLGPVIADAAARGIVDRLRTARWANRLGWSHALQWFGHQNQSLQLDPMRVLVQLSRQVQIQNASVQENVDDLLIGALLADLREGMARVANRPSNAVILLDNGDSPEATTFVNSLLRVRRSLAAKATSSGPPGPPDPLALVVTSDGRLSTLLGGWSPRRSRLAESELKQLTPGEFRRPGAWLAVVLDDLSPEDVQHLVNEYLWPPELGTSVVAAAVHHLTSGYPQATRLALQNLQQAPELIDDLSTVLSRAFPDSELPVDRYLVNRILVGLSPFGQVDPRLLEDLVTLSAARDREEAESLAVLMTAPAAIGAALLSSATLWSGRGPRECPAMSTFVRYLLLRLLAGRPQTHLAHWDSAFSVLLGATTEGDLGGRLHHRMALGDTAEVVGTLAELLSGMPGEPWLDLLDQAIATPDSRRPRSPGALDETPELAELTESAANTQPQGVFSSVGRLVTHLRSLRDPRFTDRTARGYCCLLVAHELGRLAPLSPGSRRVFVDRAEIYRRKSDALA